jgi:hypothetical protein
MRMVYTDELRGNAKKSTEGGNTEATERESCGGE